MLPGFLHVAQDFSREASHWLEKRVLSGARSVFLPAGRTPETLYALWENEKPSWLSGVRFKQIDDVLTGPQAGVFRQFFETHLPSYVNQFEWIDRADSEADVAVLGLGLNGHIAFHEPVLPRDFLGGCVQLTEITRRTLGLADPTWGITYGASTFMKCRSILMIAAGETKRDVVARLCERSTSLPATSLLQHRDFSLIVDQAAVNVCIDPQ